MSRRVAIIGAGRAGGAFASAARTAGWRVGGPIGRDATAIADAAGATELVLICVDDPSVADVARSIVPNPDCVIAHCAGSLGLDVLAGHERVAAVHPLVSLPSAEVGAKRLVGAWFAVDGDPVVGELVAALGGTAFTIADEHRVQYHAAACIAANHLVALLGQVERIGGAAGAPFEAYLDLVRGAVANVAELGPAAALTGPAARGDEATIQRHLAAIDPSERDAYAALADQARRLARDHQGA